MHHGIFKAEQAGILSLPVLLPAPAQRHLTRYPVIVAVDGNAGLNLISHTHTPGFCMAMSAEPDTVNTVKLLLF
ncbi:hypothetical protein [Nitratidesulfovibrio vulgaris]|uniref:hypothetical protein n=1 Tax=Nitratidesulfovibrio vulgaris TaxID=881 RepID=UPI0023006902|nr:hypothetical protein [Nitratidesulfovibrio vulgaris]WCB45352.1 hypothetical protein PH214_09725 [Nitratidesulfovibrio vulgaris]